MAHLRLKSGRLVPVRDVHRIGSLPDQHLHLPYKGVSRDHASLKWTGEVWSLLPTGSNGTWRNGRRLADGQAIVVRANDVLRFAVPDAEVEVVDVGPPGPFAIGPGDRILEPTEDVLDLPSGAYLVCEGGEWQVVRDEERSVLPSSLHIVDDGVDWAVYVPPEEMTVRIPDAGLRLADAEAVLTNGGNDEFGVELVWTHRRLDLRRYHSHEVLYRLAEARAADRAAGIDEVDCGWRLREDVDELVGQSRNLTLQWVCHSRRRAREAGVEDGDAIVEGRDAGRILRFGVERFHLRDA